MAPRIGPGPFPRLAGGTFPMTKPKPCTYRTRFCPGNLTRSKALIGFGVNYRMWPDSRRIPGKPGQLDLFVNADPFKHRSLQATPTSCCRPARSVERSELRCNDMLQILIFTQPAIAPLYDSRSDIEIMLGLANRLGLGRSAVSRPGSRPASTGCLDRAD